MRHRTAVALVVVALATSACGARLDQVQVDALARARSDRAGAAGGPGVTAAAGGPVTTIAGGGPAGPAATTPVGGGGPVGSGGPTVTAGPAGGGGAATPGEAASTCTPRPTDEIGVTDTEITLGEVATISGPVPGLAQTTVNGVKAYVAYRNALGGVCGRQLRIDLGDDRLDTGQNRAETQRLMGRVLGFVGGWGVTDDGGATALEGSGVPDVGIAISDQRAAYTDNYSSNPIPTGTSGAEVTIDYIVRTERPASAAVVWPGQAAVRGRAQAFIRALEAAGVPVVVQREISITETNWVPIAQEIEDAGAEFLITAMEITQISRLAQAFQQIGYLPRIPFYGAQSYGQQLIELAGPAANGALIAITHPIVEEAATAPGMATMLEWYQRVNPGQPIDFFSFQGWIAASMFADALELAGPAPTRESVIAALRTFTAYDAHGMIAPINPAGKVGSRCFMLVKVVDQRWTRVFPDSGFHCE